MRFFDLSEGAFVVGLLCIQRVGALMLGNISAAAGTTFAWAASMCAKSGRRSAGISSAAISSTCTQFKMTLSANASASSLAMTTTSHCSAISMTKSRARTISPATIRPNVPLIGCLTRPAGRGARRPARMPLQTPFTASADSSSAAGYAANWGSLATTCMQGVKWW